MRITLELLQSEGEPVHGLIILSSEPTRTYRWHGWLELLRLLETLADDDEHHGSLT